MAENKGPTKAEEEAKNQQLLQSIAISNHINNFMEAIQLIKDCKVKRADFNSVTTIYRVGSLARIDIKAPLDPEKLAALPQDELLVPKEITEADMEMAARVASQMTNFMEAIQMVKDGKVRRIDYNEKTMIYRVADIVRIDIKAPV